MLPPMECPENVDQPRPKLHVLSDHLNQNCFHNSPVVYMMCKNTIKRVQKVKFKIRKLAPIHTSSPINALHIFTRVRNEQVWIKLNMSGGCSPCFTNTIIIIVLILTGWLDEGSISSASWLGVSYQPLQCDICKGREHRIVINTSAWYDLLTRVMVSIIPMVWK